MFVEHITFKQQRNSVNQSVVVPRVDSLQKLGIENENTFHLMT